VQLCGAQVDAHGTDVGRGGASARSRGILFVPPPPPLSREPRRPMDGGRTPTALDVWTRPSDAATQAPLLAKTTCCEPDASSGRAGFRIRTVAPRSQRATTHERSEPASPRGTGGTSYLSEPRRNTRHPRRGQQHCNVGSTTRPWTPAGEAGAAARTASYAAAVPAPRCGSPGGPPGRPPLGRPMLQPPRSCGASVASECPGPPRPRRPGAGRPLSAGRGSSNSRQTPAPTLNSWALFRGPCRARAPLPRRRCAAGPP
jgi:hypothetical protein